MTEQKSLTIVDQRDDIAWVTINRPGDRNSINTPLMNEIDKVLTEIEAGPTRAVIFTGAGDEFFSGGADAVEMMRYGPEGARDFSERIQNLFNRFEASPLILVAAINGLSYGGGFEFALACDFRIMADTARVGLPEVRVGIIPGGGGTQRLTRLVGQGVALEMILTGRLYSAKAALAMCLVHRVVPKAELAPTATDFLKPVLRNPQYALSRAKTAVRSAHELNWAEGLATERNEFKECFAEDFFVSEIFSQIQSGQMPTTEDPTN